MERAMAVAQRIDPATYEHLAVRDEYRFVELRDGVLVEKPPVSFLHAWTIEGLTDDLRRQLDRRAFVVFSGSVRLRAAASYLVPDIVVVPADLARALVRRDPHRPAVYDEPVPLVVEVWSPSTGSYNLDAKIPTYRTRGDREIWRPHPYERTLTAWVRRDDGSYAETVVVGGVVESVALPGVRVDLGTLFG